MTRRQHDRLCSLRSCRKSLRRPCHNRQRPRAHARGGPAQLVYEQAPAPSAGPGEALIAVHAAAITFAELTWDLEWTTRDGADRTPVIPSHEMSGTVAGLGDGIAGLAVGDEVIGLVDFDRDGAAAEYVIIPADPGAQDPDGRAVGPVLVVTADCGVLADRPDVIHEHVGRAQLGDRGAERGAQAAGVRGVRDVVPTCKLPLWRSRADEGS